MKGCKIIGVVVVCVLLAVAKDSARDAIAKLRRLQPIVNWNAKAATVVDVDCDGKPDTVVFGADGAKVYVGIVSARRASKPQVFSFPISSHTQDGFCAVPVRIESSPLECEASVGPLSGCKPIKKCRSFSVVDEDCDPFNFYWDSSRKSLAWWRN